MPRLPDLVALLHRRGEAELGAALIHGELFHHLDLLLDAGLGAVELEEQRGRHGVVELGILVDGVDLHSVQQFDARDGDAGLDGHDGGVDRALDGLKGAGRRGDLLGDAV